MTVGHAVMAAEADGDVLRLRFVDGCCLELLALMLRENSPDPETTHPLSGERRISLSQLADNLTIERATSPDGLAVDVRFSDGLETTYSSAWLHGLAVAGADCIEIPAETWDAKGPIERFEWSAVAASLHAERALLRAVASRGVALLSGTPLDESFVERFAGRIGPLRESNFGRVFDVCVEATPISNAYSTEALAPHTDLSTREYQPGLQHLHCLENEAQGGDSFVVDGRTLCRRLREVDEKAWHLLTSRPVPFANRSASCDYRWSAPLIGLDAHGELDTLRFTMWLRAPMAGAIDDVREAYRALRRIAVLAESEALQVRFRLQPGDLLILDNRRVLHGRTAFDGSGRRWLRGCYGEREDIWSRLRMIERVLAPSTNGAPG